MKKKRSQAAMEFMLTYGWALLVVITAIFAMAYFGVLDMARLMPNKCWGSTGFECRGFASVDGESNTVEFIAKNNFGVYITILDQSVGGRPVQVGPGDCSATLAPVADPGSGFAGDINVSTGNPAPDPITYTETKFAPNSYIRIKAVCPSNLKSGDKFQDTVYVSYRNEDTTLEHTVEMRVRTNVI